MIPLAILLVTLLAAGGSDGTLRVKTDVAAVKVFLDDQEAGETPLTITPVAPGRHRLSLLKPGYQDHIQEVEVQAGATVKLFVVMKPTEISLPSFPVQYRVLHQHRSGACIGQLTVTAEAVDYRSDNEQDVFHIPIRDIRSVARSAGSVPFGLGLAVDLAVAAKYRARVVPCRLEAPGRGYGFWAMDQESKTSDPDKLDEAAAQKTSELSEILYRLWNASLKKPRQ